MCPTLNWPVLPETHTAVELIDELFSRHSVERTGDVTNRYTDNDHTYHHFRIVVPFRGIAALTETEYVLQNENGSVTLEHIHDNAMQFLVDTHDTTNA